jgi:regulator of protease activity HflC (stomatin/prohibitin superfamily)
MQMLVGELWTIVIVIPLLIVAASLKILREYERGVVFLLGRFWRVKGPGLIIVVPVIQKMVRVDLRTRVHDVPEQDVISVMDAEKAIIQVEDFLMATSQLAQTTLRSVLGQHELDEMLAARDQLNFDIQRILDEQTDAWGIKVSNVELKHVDIDESMIRAIARQAEAERHRRAKVIDAQGEAQAAEQFLAAAEILSHRPEALQLRYLTTLHSIAAENASTIVFPLPMDLMRAFMPRGDGAAVGEG